MSVTSERVEEATENLPAPIPGDRPGALARSARSLSGYLARRVAGHGMRALRRAGGLDGYATAMIGVGTLIDENDAGDAVSVRQWTYSEEPRILELVAGSDPVPPDGGVCTTVSLVDARDRRYSLRNGYFVDPSLRVVYEEALVDGFPFRGIAVRRLEEPRHVDGVVACLRQEDNYGHFLLLALPLLAYYREALGGDADYYYLGPTVRRWHYEALELLGIPPEKVVRDAVTADRLLVAIADRQAGYDRDFLLYPSTRLAGITPESRPGTRRLFVSRDSAAHRRVLNEAECIAALRDAYGFEAVATEKLTVRDEIALFGDAELIVGPHGAGMINCVFAPPRTALIELASETYWYPQAAQLTAVKQQRFALVTGPPAGFRVGIADLKHDFTVDVERLLEVVGNAIAAEAR